MFNIWFGKNETTDLRLSESEKSPDGKSSVDRSEQYWKRLSGQAAPAVTEQNNRKPAKPPNPPPFEEIYQTAAVKPPKLAYGIEKVVEMANSAHLAGMSPELKRRALLMALEAAKTDVGEVLNDVVTRQRALKEYEESYLEKVKQFEAAQAEQNRLQKAELEKITAQFQARMDASLAEVERWQDGFREWLKSKQHEVQRLTEAAALFVPPEKTEEEDRTGKITPIGQWACGAYR
jgi:hypothetical protein